jgi:hypothetical protein
MRSDAGRAINRLPSRRGRGSPACAEQLTIYSPAPVTTALHRLNADLVAALCSRGLPAQVVAVPLPDSINAINALPPEEKARHLPIVTTVDFLPAIRRQGPDWHAYSRASADLKLAAALYDVAFGLLATSPGLASPQDLRGKRIGVPARPSSVRVLTEALLRDGWGMLDAVQLIDLPPSAVPDAVSSGRIDATTWNLMTISSEGVSPLIPLLSQRPGASWVEVDDGAVARMNAANPFKISGLRVRTDRIEDAGPCLRPVVNLLSFRQGLAVWASTPDTIVNEILECLRTCAAQFTRLSDSVGRMVSWPFLAQEMVHPAACEFFRRHGVEIG